MRNPKREMRKARKKMAKKDEEMDGGKYKVGTVEKCPHCGAWVKTGIPVEHDGLRIQLQWKGGVIDQRFVFDPGLRREQEGNFPVIFRYIHNLLGMWEQWMQQQFKIRNPRNKIITPGSSKIIKGSLNIDTGRKP